MNSATANYEAQLKKIHVKVPTHPPPFTHTTPPTPAGWEDVRGGWSDHYGRNLASFLFLQKLRTWRGDLAALENMGVWSFFLHSPLPFPLPKSYILTPLSLPLLLLPHLPSLLSLYSNGSMLSTQIQGQQSTRCPPL